MGEVQPFDRGDDLELFRSRAPKELASRGRVEEQVDDLDRGARRAGPREATPELPAFQRDAGGGLLVRGPRHERESAHGADGRERLAPEPKGLDVVDRALRGELAGRVTFDRKGELVRGDARSVIGHVDAGETAFLEGDRHGGRARVERVLDQLLHDRGRALDDLSRRDPFDRRRVEASDRRAGRGRAGLMAGPPSQREDVGRAAPGP